MNLSEDVAFRSTAIREPGSDDELYINPTPYQLYRLFQSSSDGVRVLDVDGVNYAVGDSYVFFHTNMRFLIKRSGYEYSPKSQNGFLIIIARPTAAHVYRLGKANVEVVFTNKNGDRTANDVPRDQWPDMLRRVLKPIVTETFSFIRSL